MYEFRTVMYCALTPRVHYLCVEPCMAWVGPHIPCDEGVGGVGVEACVVRWVVGGA